MKNKSFTLIEILLVIIIIGILASIILFSTQDAYDKEQKMELLNLTAKLKSKNLESLVSEWNFDGPSFAGSAATNSDVKDAWGHNHGNVTGHAPTVKDGEDCVFGKCLYFDGVNNYVDLGFIPKYSSYTFSFWINGERDQSVGGIIHSGGGSYYRWGISLEDGKIYSRITNETISDSWSIEKYSSVNYPEGWHFIVITDTEAERSFYKNGKHISNRLNNIINSGQSQIMNLGKGGTAGASYFEGMIDEVNIYNKALSVSEVKQNYVAGLESMLKNGAISKQEYNKRILSLAKDD